MNRWKTFLLGVISLGMTFGAVGGMRLTSNDTVSEVKAVTADYTLAPVKGSNNSYAGNCDVTVNGITWNVNGNSQTIPWRLGGKSISNTDRTVYSKTPYSSAVSKIDLTVGAASSITVNSLKLVYSTNSDFSSSKEVSGAFVVNSKISFAVTSSNFPANAYYKFVFNVTVSATSNKFVAFSKVEFYNAAGGGGVTPEPEPTDVELTGISVICDDTSSLKPGQTKSLSVAYTPTNTTETGVSWTSSNSGVATVDALGVVTAVAEGSTTITATSTVEGRSEISGSYSVAVENYPVPALAVGQTYVLYGKTESTKYELSSIENTSGNYRGESTSFEYFPKKKYPLTVCEGVYPNTVALKNGDKYLKGIGNYLNVENTVTRDSSWVISTKSGGSFECVNVATTPRHIYFSSQANVLAFGDYASGDIYFEDASNKHLYISSTASEVRGESTLEFTIHTDIQSGSVVWNNSNGDAGSIVDGVFTASADFYGKTKISCTKDGVTSNEIEVLVKPAAESVISIATALEICKAQGKTESADQYVVNGYVKNSSYSNSKCSFNMAEAPDGEATELYIYQLTSTNLANGTRVSVKGKLCTWISGSSSKPEIKTGTVSFFYEVKFMNGQEQYGETQTVSGNSLITKPADPSKEGYSFVGWYKTGASTAWNFESDKVNANTILVAKWKNNALAGLNNVAPHFGLGFYYERNVVYQQEFYFVPSAGNGTINGTNGATLDFKGYFSISGANSTDDARGMFTATYNYGTSVNAYIKPGEMRMYDGTSLVISLEESKKQLGYSIADVSYVGNAGLSCAIVEGNAVFSASATIKAITKLTLTLNTPEDGKSGKTVFEKADFRLRFAVDDMTDFVSSFGDDANLQEYGIRMVSSNAGVGTKYFDAKKKLYNSETNPAGTMYQAERKGTTNLLYVNVKLGDVFANLSRVNDEFTISAYVKYDGEYVSSEKTMTHSLKSMIEHYRDNGVAAVDGLLEDLKGLGVNFE